MKTQTVTIVGMGRIGASVGLALKASSLDVTVIGHDGDRGLAQQAKKMGAIDRIEWNLVNAAVKADILVLSAPVTELETTLQVIDGDLREHTLVIDISQLKGAGKRWAESYLHSGHYIGAVPVLEANALAEGLHGLDGARSDLFQNSVFCLVPSATAEPKAVETAVNFGLVLGAVPYFMDADEYDNLVQGVETVPGLVAAALFSAVHKAAGWRDILRFAGSSFAISTSPLQLGPEIAHMALNDKEATLRWLNSLIEELQTVRNVVYQEDEETLRLLLEDLYDKRTLWLLDREKNEWVEGEQPDIAPPGLAEQMFGRLAGRRKRDE